MNEKTEAFAKKVREQERLRLRKIRKEREAEMRGE